MSKKELKELILKLFHNKELTEKENRNLQKVLDWEK